MEAFRKLTLELPMSAERLYRIRFRENFEKFVVEVRGFLLIKWKYTCTFLEFRIYDDKFNYVEMSRAKGILKDVFQHYDFLKMVKTMVFKSRMQNPEYNNPMKWK